MKKIMIAAGEASGDVLGADLARSLKRLCPSLQIKGIGGALMESVGVEILFDISELAAVGISEVVRNLRRIRAVFYGFCDMMEKENPDVLILIDYPGFNMRLARQAKKRNIKVIYYVSPQIWAWGKDRVYSIANSVDRMLVIFPFEKNFYQKFGICADYVGHPVVDRIGSLSKNQIPERKITFPVKNPVICLLPGSRRQEIARHLPVMLESARLIKKSIPGSEFVIGRAGTISRKMIQDIKSKIPVEARIEENAECEAVAMSDFVLTSSGTATVETAYFKKPMIVMYRVSALTWIFAKLFVKVKDIAMVNVMAGRRIVPEFLQSGARPSLIARGAVSILSDGKVYREMVSELGEVRKQLGAAGAGERAARLVLETAGVKIDE